MRKWVRSSVFVGGAATLLTVISLEGWNQNASIPLQLQRLQKWVIFKYKSFQESIALILRRESKGLFCDGFSIEICPQILVSMVLGDRGLPTFIQNNTGLYDGRKLSDKQPVSLDGIYMIFKESIDEAFPCLKRKEYRLLRHCKIIRYCLMNGKRWKILLIVSCEEGHHDMIRTTELNWCADIIAHMFHTPIDEQETTVGVGQFIIRL
ncbi:unnamed protein product [Vicia faba]|uniref:Uncharacterized protein n=1 Tax=Vicia faba TaxID=3906 RepID=A0AAV0YTC2_VICFA|nr:unnamed protein product [Vicia faba]